MLQQVDDNGFQACDACTKRPEGSTLCSACLHNRYWMESMNEELKRLRHKVYDDRGTEHPSADVVEISRQWQEIVARLLAIVSERW